MALHQECKPKYTMAMRSFWRSNSGVSEEHGLFFSFSTFLWLNLEFCNISLSLDSNIHSHWNAGFECWSQCLVFFSLPGVHILKPIPCHLRSSLESCNGHFFCQCAVPRESKPAFLFGIPVERAHVFFWCSYF